MAIDNDARGIAGLSFKRTDPTIRRLRESIAAARQSSPLRATPWRVPPAWTGSMVVQGGERVSNGGNVYAAVGSGTAAASGGPTGTGFAPITDGTIRWEYAGPLNYTTDPAAPTYSTSTTASTLGRFYRPAASAFSSGAAVVVTSDAWFERWGQFAAGADVIGPFTAGNASAFAFDVQGSASICIAQSAAAGLYAPIIEIDGRLLVSGAIPFAATSGTNYLTINLPDTERHAVVVRAVSTNIAPNAVKGVYCDQYGEIMRPRKAAGDIVGHYISDSFSVVAPAYYGESVPRTIAGNMFDALGIRKWYLDAVGGTGFVAGGVDVFTSATRMGYVNISKPDVLTVICPVPDNSKTVAEIITGFNTWYAQMRAYVPNAVIVVLGCMGKTSTGELVSEQAIRQAIAAISDSKLLFIPASGATPEAWITGTGRATSPTGTGNSNAFIGDDGLHPLNSGQRYLGMRAGSAVINAVAALA